MDKEIKFDLDTPRIEDASKVRSVMAVRSDTGEVGAVNMDLLVLEAGKRVGGAVKIDSNVLPELGDADKSAEVYGGSAGRILTYKGVALPALAPDSVAQLFWDGAAKTWSKVDEAKLPVSELTSELIPDNTSVGVNGAGVSRIAYDVRDYSKIAESQSESNSSFAFESSTFSHWGTQVGVYKNFKAIKIKLRPWSASHIPTKIRVLIRTAVNSGIVLGDKTIDVLLEHNVLKDVIVEFDNLIANSESSDLWCEVRTNGRVGIFKLTMAVTRNAYYGTSSNLSTGLTAVSTSPNDQMWCEFLSVVTDLKFSEKAESLVKEISGGTDSAEIILPGVIYALEGLQANVYFDNIISSTLDITNLDIDVSGSKGRHNQNYWTYTPIVSDVGVSNLTITVNTRSGRVLTSKVIQVVTVARSSGAGVVRNVNMWGDSNLAGGQPLSIINTELTSDVMTVNFKGTLGAGNARHEGRAGWRIFDYTNAGQNGSGNPLWIGGALNFPSYLANNSITMAANDWVVIQLGTNDMFNASSDSAMITALSSAVTNMNKLITAFKAVAGIRIAVCTSLTCAISQDSFGDDYNNGQRKNRFKRNMQMFANRICEEYEGRESENIFVIPTQQVIDPVHGFPYVNVNANSRSTEQIRAYTNAIHPNQSGYDQLGDAILSFLKSQEV